MTLHLGCVITSREKAVIVVHTGVNASAIPLKPPRFRMSSHRVGRDYMSLLVHLDRANEARQTVVYKGLEHVLQHVRQQSLLNIDDSQLVQSSQFP